MWTSTAWAAGSGAASASPISTLLFLIGVVAAAYVLAHLVVERAQQRFLFVSGAEYVGLGVVLGPAVFPVHLGPLQDLDALAPVFAFVAGWVGLLYGLELDLRSLRGAWRPLRIALVDALVTGSIVTGAAFLLLRSGLLVPVEPWAAAWTAALVLGAAAAAGSSSAIDLLASRYGGLESELLPTLRKAVRLGDLVAVSVFGLVFCLFHDGATLTAAPPTPLVWVLVTLGLGLALGLLFFLFLGDDDREANVFLGMVGILLFASGAAFFLRLAAVTVNLVLGGVLAQTPLGGRIGRELDRTAKPVSLVLLLFAGAMWQPVPLVPGLVVTAGYVGLRVVGKVSASLVATIGTPLRADLFRGTLAQGNAAVAMAVSFRIVYDGPVVDLVYTAILAGTVLSELVSPRILRGLLVDAGELREDLGPSPAGR